MILLAVLGGCGAPRNAAAPLAEAPRARFIDVETPHLLDLSTLHRTEPVEIWDLESSAEADRWTVRPDAARLASTDGLRVRAPRGHARLTCPTDLEAASVHSLEVVVTGLQRGRLRLRWAEPDKPLPEAPLLSLPANRGAGPDGSTYRFAVAGNPRWRGRIGTLQLELVVLPGDEVVLHTLTAQRAVPLPDRLADAASRPWKVEIDHDVRNALLALPGSAVARTLTVPRGASLHFSYGLTEGTHQAVSFRVVARGRLRSRELWSSRLDPRDGETGRWHEASVDLAALEGRSVELRLETTADGPFEAAPGLPVWANPEVRHPADRAPLHVLLVSIDTLRADHLSLYGYPRPTSPHLDEWARSHAVVFSAAIAAAPWTLPSHMSLLTGEEAIHHGVNHDVGGADRAGCPADVNALVTMAELLRTDGFATAAFTGGGYLHPKYGFAQGFDAYSYWPDRGRDETELSTDVDRALGWLERHRDEASFVFLHTYEVHDPYTVRQPYFSRFAGPGAQVPRGRVALVSPPTRADDGFAQHNTLVFRSRAGERPVTRAELPMVRTLYDSDVAYTDEQLGRLLGGLERLGIEDRTLVVITADHGEALGEHGRAGHVDLYDSVLRVPLVIGLPQRGDAGRVVTRQVRLIDVLPTVLDVLSVAPPAAVDGVSLVPLLTGEAVPDTDDAWSYSAAADRGLALRRGGRWKYIFNNTAWAPLNARQELYDLTTDHAETTNLARGSPVAGRLRTALRQHWSRRATGLRLAITNRSTGTLEGEIRGGLVRPVGTKSVDSSGPYLRWLEMGRAAFVVPPGVRMVLHFEKVFGERVDLVGKLETPGSAVPFSEDVRLGDLLSPLSLTREGGQWRRHEGAMDNGETGFSLWWQGAVAIRSESPAVHDSELRAQLEALGYVN